MGYFEHIDAKDIPSDHPVSVFNSIWKELEQKGAPVAWNDVRPKEAAAALPWLLLLEPRDDGRYYYRICGTGCEMLFGRPHQGKFFGEDIPESARQTRYQEFDRILSGSEPMFSEATLPMPDKDTKEIYRGVFGFSSDGGEIDKIGVVVAPKQSFGAS